MGNDIDEIFDAFVSGEGGDFGDFDFSDTAGLDDLGMEEKVVASSSAEAQPLATTASAASLLAQIPKVPTFPAPPAPLNYTSAPLSLSTDKPVIFAPAGFAMPMAAAAAPPLPTLFPLGHMSKAERRSRALARYRDKKRRRVWTKKTEYQVRKDVATKRRRVNGRFVRAGSGFVSISELQG